MPPDPIEELIAVWPNLRGEQFDIPCPTCKHGAGKHYTKNMNGCLLCSQDSPKLETCDWTGATLVVDEIERIRSIYTFDGKVKEGSSFL